MTKVKISQPAQVYNNEQLGFFHTNGLSSVPNVALTFLLVLY
jgi:hypothetical protein